MNSNRLVTAALALTAVCSLSLLGCAETSNDQEQRDFGKKQLIVGCSTVIK